jgi:hypothetical protein
MAKPSPTSRRDKSKGKHEGDRKDDIRERRKAQAKLYIKEELSKGRRLSTLEDIQRILRKYEKKHGLDTGHFDCLETKDLCNLALEMTFCQAQPPNSIDRPSQSANTKTQHGQSTPVTSDSEERSEVQEEQAEDADPTQGNDLPILPMEGVSNCQEF